MRFIRKNGRVIPIKDKKDYQKGYGTTGALAGAGFASYQAGLAAAQHGMKQGLHGAMRTGRHVMFGGKGKLAAGLLGAGVGLMTASKLNAGYRIARTPKGERMAEVAKHGVAAGIGYKIGAWVGLPFMAHNVKSAGEIFASARAGRPVNVSWSSIGKAVFKKKSQGGLSSPLSKTLRLKTVKEV